MKSACSESVPLGDALLMFNAGPALGDHPGPPASCDAFLWTRALFWHRMAVVQAANVTTTVP
jgi:hypothetical protein